MILAVFGDVHGALDAMYKCVGRFEEKHRVRVVGVLQVGDMGVFPDPARLDQATWKRAKEDTTELGAADYVLGKKKASHPTWFVRGNHEDFDFLMRRRNVCIDPYNMIHHVFVGPVKISSGGERCVVAGLGDVEDEYRFRMSAGGRRANIGGSRGSGSPTGTARTAGSTSVRGSSTRSQSSWRARRMCSSPTTAPRATSRTQRTGVHPSFAGWLRGFSPATTSSATTGVDSAPTTTSG